MKPDKFLGALGLARRAGKMERGFDAVCAAAQRGAAALALVAQDVSDGTKKRVETACTGHCEVLALPYTMHQLVDITGKTAGVLAVTDKNLAVLCQKALLPQQGGPRETRGCEPAHKEETL